MERETGFEPATSSLEGWRSTAELFPHLNQPTIIEGGEGRIRTSEAAGDRFTVCSLCPLGNLPFKQYKATHRRRADSRQDKHHVYRHAPFSVGQRTKSKNQNEDKPGVYFLEVELSTVLLEFYLRFPTLLLSASLISLSVRPLLFRIASSFFCKWFQSFPSIPFQFLYCFLRSAPLDQNIRWRIFPSQNQNLQ